MTGFAAHHHPEQKISTSLIFTILLLVFGVVGVIFVSVVINADRKLRDDLLAQGDHFASAIDRDLLAAVLRNPGDEHLPEYQELKHRLEFSIQLNTRIHYVYFIGKRADGSLFFLMDTGQPSNRDVEARPGELYEDAPDELLHLYDRLETTVIGPYTDQWGTFITTLTPFADLDNNGQVAVMGLDVDSSERFSNVFAASLPLALVMIAFLLLFVVALILLIRQLKKSLLRQHLATNALQQSEEIQHRLLQAVPDLIVKTDMTGTINFVNDRSSSALANQVGNEILGKNVFSFIVKNDVQRAMENAKLRLDQAVGVEEYQLVFADNVVIDAEINGAVICDSESRALGMVYVVRDISDRKKSEEALKRSESRFRTLLKEVKSVAVQGYRPDGTIIYWNKASEDLYGYSDQEALGRNLIDLIIPEEMQEQVRQAFHEMEDSTDPHPSGEIRLRHKDGRILEMFTSHALYRAADGSTELYSFDIDLSARKKAEESVREMQSRLFQTQKMESIGLLAGGVAHDFNNMLGVILGYVQLAMRKVGTDEPLHANLDEIRKAAERSANLTRQLLAFARKQTVAPKVLDLNETVNGMLNMLRRLIGEDMDLAWRPGGNLRSIYIDPSQMDQILTNLCVNARDAIADTGKITIETDSFTFDEAYCADHAGFVPGEFVMLAVSDDGCGMDAETFSHLFEPFFSTKEMGKGTGLGLATVHGIVKQNNGFINVYSEQGHGTTFKIYLPQHAAKAAPRSEQEQVPVPVTGGETILLVEDEPAILELTTMMLEEMGYAVIAAGSPGEAIRLAREHHGRIALLMTDVVMPEMNGRDLAGNLISIDPDIRCLFMSGYTANVIAHHGVLDQGVHFLQKPFSMQDVAAKIRAALDRKEAI